MARLRKVWWYLEGLASLGLRLYWKIPVHDPSSLLKPQFLMEIRLVQGSKKHINIKKLPTKLDLRPRPLDPETPPPPKILCALYFGGENDKHTEFGLRSLPPRTPSLTPSEILYVGFRCFSASSGKKKAYTALLQCRTFLCRKKWGPQRKDFGGGYGFPVFS